MLVALVGGGKKEKKHTNGFFLWRNEMLLLQFHVVQSLLVCAFI